MSAKKKPVADQNLTHAVSLRLTPSERERLEALAGETWPMTILMRRAMAVGLDAIEADPSLMFDRKVRK